MSKKIPEIRFKGFNDEWISHKLGDMIDISSASRVHKEEWTSEGTPFFRSSDVISKYMKKYNTPAFISDTLYQELSKKSGKMKAGDLLVTGGGTIGVPYLIENEDPLYFKDADLIWLKNSGVIDGSFLYNFYISPQTRRYISSITHIGTISHYTIEQGKNTPISLPVKSEQEIIGTFFKQLEVTIALQQQLVKQQQQYKKAMLQKMFPQKGERVPKIRFKGFTGDWKEKRLVTIFDTITDYVANGSFESIRNNVTYYDEPNYAYMIRLQDASNNWKGPWVYTDESSYSFLKKSKLYSGDIIMSNVGSVGKFFLVPELDKPMTLAPNSVLIRSSTCNQYFIYQLMLTNNVQSSIEQKTTPGVQNKINKTDFKKIETLIPSIKEQQKIGTFFKQLDDTIALQENKLENCQQLKKALLQRMFV